MPLTPARYGQSSCLLQSILIQSRAQSLSLPRVRPLNTASVPSGQTVGATKFEPPDRDGHLAEVKSKHMPLSILPLGNLIRSFAITSLSSYPAVLKFALRTLSHIANSQSVILDPDRNPVLHFFLRKTFYDHFCAGETPDEVHSTLRRLKDIGFSGVMLAYGKEIVLDKGESAASLTRVEEPPATDKPDPDVQEWKQGALKTVELTEHGDFAALKITGAGKETMRHLIENRSNPSKEMDTALTEICELAKGRGVGLLFDAEQSCVQKGIDAWTLVFQKRFNKEKAVVYNTYQAYLHSMPTVLRDHLQDAQQHDYVLGIKLVRGAYLASDPKDIFCASKASTDENFDKVADSLLQRSWNSALKSSGELNSFPRVDLVLATHNRESVRKALRIQEQHHREDKQPGPLVLGQLMGMADEISCDLVLASRRAGAQDYGPRAYQYLVWGSVRDCLKYLIRRAEENRDAAIRAIDTRIALKGEIMRRL